MKSDAVLTDDQLTVLQARMKRRRLLVVMGMLACLTSSFVIAFASGLSDRLDARAVLVLGVGGAALFVCLGMITWQLWRLQEPEAVQRQLIRRNADALQRTRSLALLSFAVLALLVSPFLWLTTGRLMEGMGEFTAVSHLSMWLLLAITNLSFVLGGAGSKILKPVYNDEFSRVLRARAVLIGFFTLLCGVIAAFALGVREPALAIQALPLVVLYAVAATTVSYAVMDLRAGRGE
jgi:hypothetical protein